MPNAYVLNQIPTTYAQAHWLLIQMLAGAGWTFKSSGDGLAAYNASGNVFSNGAAAGANGFGQAKAWARMADPSGLREIVYQHDNAGGLRLKYSASALFTGGSPSATVTPSATDERYLRGAASDAVPSYGGGWLDAGVATGVTKFQGAALAAAPYGFWFAGATTPAGSIRTGLLMDPVDGAAEDTDPYVWHIATAASFSLISSGGGLATINGNSTSGAGATGCWAFMDVARTVFAQVNAAMHVLSADSSGQINTASLGGLGGANNPFNSKAEALPVLYARYSGLANPGIKGWSRLLRWTCMSRTTFVDTLDTKAWIAVGVVWMPWDGTTTPTN